ncbi:PTS sugar transporter subunit IIA [Lacticaseibacillus pantheris]
MLTNYTNLNAIAVRQKDSDPASVLSHTGDLLTAGGFANHHYTTAILDSFRSHGAYFVIAPGITLPHARPEQGARRTGISILTLTRPVEFGNAANGPANLLIGLAATSSDNHIELLQELVVKLSERWRYTAIIEATTKASVLHLLK